jgi:hypothetical protein
VQQNVAGSLDELVKLTRLSCSTSPTTLVAADNAYWILQMLVD